MESKNVIITGGAGFIGSHIAEHLNGPNRIKILDDFSVGFKKNIESIDAEVVEVDVSNSTNLAQHFKDANVVFHYAAKLGKRVESDLLFKTNVNGTWNVLEACRLNDIELLVFPSSQAVYAKSKMVPTPEEAEFSTTSHYGMSKILAENMIRFYSETYGLKSLVLRYSMIVGPKLQDGPVFDFFNKLKKNNKELKIFGDGTQRRSLLDIRDCLDATFLAIENSDKNFDVFNVANQDTVSIKEIAEIVADSMKLKNMKFIFTEPPEWDVPLILPSIEKIRKLGWKPHEDAKEGIKNTIRWWHDSS